MWVEFALYRLLNIRRSSLGTTDLYRFFPIRKESDPLCQHLRKQCHPEKKKCSKWREIVMTQKETSRESYLIFYYIDEVDYTVSHFRITKFEHVLLVATISSIISFYFQAKSIKKGKYCFRKHCVCKLLWKSRKRVAGKPFQTKTNRAEVKEMLLWLGISFQRLHECFLFFKS